MFFWKHGRNLARGLHRGGRTPELGKLGGAAGGLVADVLVGELWDLLSDLLGYGDTMMGMSWDIYIYRVEFNLI